MVLLLHLNPFHENFKIISLLAVYLLSSFNDPVHGYLIIFKISVRANVHRHRMTNTFTVKENTLDFSFSPVKVYFLSSSPCTRWKLACNLKYYKISPKYRLTDRKAMMWDSYETETIPGQWPGWRPRPWPCPRVLPVCSRKCQSWFCTHTPRRQNAQVFRTADSDDPQGIVQSWSMFASWSSIREAAGRQNAT